LGSASGAAPRRRADPLPIEQVQEMLARTATTAERVEGLLALGLAARELADAVGVASSSTVRNWVSEDSEPRLDASIALDDLRAVALILLEGGLEPRRAGLWITSRDPGRLEGQRPIELVRRLPLEVLSSAHDLLLEIFERTAAARRAGGKTESPFSS
jgi:hypothetical protein